MKNVLFDDDGSNEFLVGFQKAASILGFRPDEIDYLKQLGVLKGVPSSSLRTAPTDDRSASERGER